MHYVLFDAAGAAVHPPETTRRQQIQVNKKFADNFVQFLLHFRFIFRFARGIIYYV